MDVNKVNVNGVWNKDIDNWTITLLYPKVFVVLWMTRLLVIVCPYIYIYIFMDTPYIFMVGWLLMHFFLRSFCDLMMIVPFRDIANTLDSMSKEIVIAI